MALPPLPEHLLDQALSFPAPVRQDNPPKLALGACAAAPAPVEPELSLFALEEQRERLIARLVEVSASIAHLHMLSMMYVCCTCGMRLRI